MKVNVILNNKSLETTNNIQKKYITRDIDKNVCKSTEPSQNLFFAPQISFGHQLQLETIDEKYFNEDSDVFSISFFNNINSFLTNYKNSAPSNESCYFKDREIADKAEAKRNVTLFNNSSVNFIKSEVADLYGFSRADEINSKEGVYLFENTEAKEIKAKKAVLSDNAVCEKIDGSIVWLKDCAISNTIKAEKVYQRNNSLSNDVTAKNFFAKDDIKCKKLNTESIILKDNAQVDEVYSRDGQVRLSNSAKINDLSVENSSIILDRNTEINHISSESNLYITGNGTVGDIDVKGTHLFLTGPVKINGHINFANPDGVVVVQKGEQNIFPVIDSSVVKNGILQFLIQNKNDGYLGNPVDVFNSGINLLNKSIEITSEENFPIHSKNVDNIANINNDPKTKILYNNFYKKYLQSLSLKDDKKKYSLYWVNNAKLGKENVVDLWMKFLNFDNKNYPDTQKNYIINNLSTEQKEILLEKTTDYWFKNVLPEIENHRSFSDFADFKSDLKKIEDFLIALNDSCGVKNIDEGILENVFHMDFCGVDFIDFLTEESSLAVNKCTNTRRLKKEMLNELISNNNSREKITKRIENELTNHKNFIKTYEISCSDLLKNEPQLDKLQRKLLEKYKDSTLFYKLIYEASNGTNDKINVELQIIKAVQLLSKEYNQLAIDARKNIFDKTLNVKDVVIAKPNTDLDNYTNFVFNSLNQNIKSMKEDDFEDFACMFKSFKNHVKKNSYFIGDYWSNLVKTAYQYYKSQIIGDITDNNLSLLYSVNKGIKQIRNDDIIVELLKDKQLDSIEKKDFVLRYKDDYNFKKMINNSGVNQSNVLRDLLTIEAMNENLYQARLDSFPLALNPESVKENLDLSDKYLVLLDKDYSDMTVAEKYRALSKVPTEEFRLMNEIVLSNWKNNELKKFMSDKFLQIQLNYNINAQSPNILEQLSLINTNLNNIRIELSGQSYSLYEIASDLNKLVDISKKSFKELYFIGESVEAINNNTQSIKANTRGILYAAMQNAKLRDSELSKTINELLPEAEKLSFKDFLQQVEKKHKILKDEKKKKHLKQIASLVTLAVAASTACTLDPSVITGLLGSGDIVQQSIPALKSIADTLKHVAVFKVATSTIKS